MNNRMNIKNRMFKIMFPSKSELLDMVIKSNNSLGEKNKSLRLELELPKPTQGDLMRDCLGIQVIDFDNVDKEGNPSHYLSGLSPDERLAFQGELNSVYKKKEFQAVLSYWINMFGNHAVRNADGDSAPGRYGINGVTMIKRSLEKARNEIIEHIASENNKEDVDPDELLVN